MNVVRTVVTGLPKTAASEKIYRVDPAPTAATSAAPGPSDSGPTSQSNRAGVGAVLGMSVVGVDLTQLLADLEAESRRVIGPTSPPRG